MHFQQRTETSKKEINFLTKLLENFLIQNINKLQNQKIKIKIIGEKKI